MKAIRARLGVSKAAISVVLLVVDVLRGQRLVEQHRNDQREHDDFLVGRGVEGGIGFEQADQDRAGRRQRIGGQAADDGADEALEADQEAGVVVDRW
jgi:hypothetical protein